MIEAARDSRTKQRLVTTRNLLSRLSVEMLETVARGLARWSVGVSTGCFRNTLSSAPAELPFLVSGVSVLLFPLILGGAVTEIFLCFWVTGGLACPWPVWVGTQFNIDRRKTRKRELNISQITNETNISHFVRDTAQNLSNFSAHTCR